jgi:hypothetical protein
VPEDFPSSKVFSFSSSPQDDLVSAEGEDKELFSQQFYNMNLPGKNKVELPDMVSDGIGKDDGSIDIKVSPRCPSPSPPKRIVSSSRIKVHLQSLGIK